MLYPFVLVALVSGNVAGDLWKIGVRLSQISYGAGLMLEILSVLVLLAGFLVMSAVDML